MDFTTFEMVVCVALFVITFGFASGLNAIEKSLKRQNEYIHTTLDQHLQDVSGVLSNIERNTDNLWKDD